jgi:hypothetical protein
MYTGSNGSYPVRGYGGFRSYSFYWGAPAWYYYTPFHPAFYFHPPVYAGGYYQPGGFNFGNLVLALVIFGVLGMFLFFVVARGVFRAISGRGGPRYTSYN